MNIFDFDNYREFIQRKVQSLQKGGRGEYQKIAKSLRLHTTYLSQVIKGPKNLNQDQSLDLCEYWKLNPLESRYFLLLVDYERAGSQKLRDYVRGQMFQIKEESKKLSLRLNKEKVLDEKAHATFYSHWLYSGIRMATSLESLQHRTELANYFNLSPQELEKIISFLLEHQLCEQQGEKIVMGPQRTHLPAESPMISKHHMNWRLRAFDNYSRMRDEDLSFTGPMSIGEKDAPIIREKITQLIKEISEIVKDSPSEKMYCFNMDWFHF